LLYQLAYFALPCQEGVVSVAVRPFFSAFYKKFAVNNNSGLYICHKGTFGKLKFNNIYCDTCNNVLNDLQVFWDT